MNALLRTLPKVDDLLRAPELEPVRREYGDSILTDSIRREVDALRRGILEEVLNALPPREEICRRIALPGSESAG